MGSPAPHTFVSPAADKGSVMPATDMMNPAYVSPAMHMPNYMSPPIDEPYMGNVMPSMDHANVGNVMPSMDHANVGNVMPVMDNTNMGYVMPAMDMGNPNMYVSPAMMQNQPYIPYEYQIPPVYGGYAPTYGAPAYPIMPYVPAQYAPPQVPYASAPMPYAPVPMPYAPVPMPYAPQEGYPTYVQGAYMPQEYSFMQPYHAPYESSSLYMPNTAPATAENNVPPMTSPAMQEDCGCDNPPQAMYPYSPPPAGMYGAPYYPGHAQTPYYQSMPYAPYTPLPGAPYYRLEQTAVFGTPDVDEDETE
jgi:hypothetical protein